MKTTIVTCDTCGTALSGTGWSTLWGKAAKIGWLKGKDGRRHYCSARCMVAQDNKQHSAKINQQAEE